MRGRNGFTLIEILLATVILSNGKITEDERDRGLNEIQKTTDAHIATIDTGLKAKEAEVMAI